MRAFETKPVPTTAESRRGIAQEQIAILQGDIADVRRRWRTYGHQSEAEANQHIAKIEAEIERFRKFGGLAR